MKIGDILEFKRSGPVSWIVGNLLWLFEPWWDKWGWHLAIVCAIDKQGKVWIAEGTAPVSRRRVIRNDEEYRVHQWLDLAVPPRKMLEVVQPYLGKKYDVQIYLWTALQYLVRHFFNHRIPRLLDDKYTCWELVFEICRDLGKGIGSKYDCPMITDFLKATEG